MHYYSKFHNFLLSLLFNINIVIIINVLLLIIPFTVVLLSNFSCGHLQLSVHVL